MKDKIFQVKMELVGSEPMIWRRLLIPADLLLSEFHDVIQISMGWKNEHLHQFTKKNQVYAGGNPFDMDIEVEDQYDKNMQVSDLLKRENSKIRYEYDFGDSWRHDIVVEKTLPFDDNITYPHCIDGKMHCPPEDCGGIGSYKYLSEVIKNPDHEDHDGISNWIGEDFDPDYFNIDDVNEALK